MTGGDEEEESDGEEGETAKQRADRKKRERMKKMWDKTIAVGKSVFGRGLKSELESPHALARMRGLLGEI